MALDDLIFVKHKCISESGSDLFTTYSNISLSGKSTKYLQRMVIIDPESECCRFSTNEIKSYFSTIIRNGYL